MYRAVHRCPDSSAWFLLPVRVDPVPQTCCDPTRTRLIRDIIRTYLELNEVKLSGAGVHQRVEVFVAGELGLDESTDVSLAEKMRKCLHSFVTIKFIQRSVLIWALNEKLAAADSSDLHRSI